jgi:phage repressor protein C with HTH and peptisase S24 domain
MSDESLGVRLRRIRKEKSLTQEVLAKLAGVGQATISDLERGRSASSSELVAIAMALGISTEHLKTGKTHIPRDQYANSTDSALSIPRLNVAGSFGGGEYAPDHEVVVDVITVPRWWVHQNMPNISSPASIRAITGYGDSMEDTFSDGDVLFVDTGVKAVKIDAIYVFERMEELYIKRIQRQMDGSIKIISDNRTKYDPIVLSPDESQSLNVLARVRWVWNGRRL